MAEHVLEVEIQTKLGSSVSDVKSFKESLEEALEVVERFQDSIGNLNIDSDLKNLLSNLSSFSGGTVRIEYGNGAPVYDSGNNTSTGSYGSIDAVAMIKSLEWATGANKQLEDVEALVSKLTPIGEPVIKDVNARVSQLGFEYDASRTLNRVSASITSAKWSDDASKQLHSTTAYITDIKQGNGAKQIVVSAVIKGIVSGESVVGTVRDSGQDGTKALASGWLPASVIPQFASGQIITVGEGKNKNGDWEDEFIIPRSELEKGPKHLDSTVSYLVRGSEGGSNVVVDNLQDTAIIPKSKYSEFKSKIYGFDFAEGHLPYGGAFANGNVIYGIESYGDMSDFINGIQSIINQAQNLSSNSFGSQFQADEFANSIMSQADIINYQLEKAITLFENVKNDTENLPAFVSSIQGLPDELDKINSTFINLNEDVTVKLAEVIGDNKRVDEALNRLIAVQGRLADHIKSVDDTTWGPTQTASANTGQSQTNPVSYSSASVEQVNASLLTRIYDEVTSGKALLKYIDSKQSENGPVSNEDVERNRKSFGTMLNMMGGVSSSFFSMGENIHETLLKRTLGAVQDIYNKMKEASPLLQSVETLFNLAMRLFFMPLGNKLAEILIPATIDLVEKVSDMWDIFDEGMTLGEMFSQAIDYGVDAFAEYFNEIGEELSNQGGLVGSIGRLLLSISNFLENHAVGLLNFLMGMMESVINHFREIIATIVAFKVASYVNTMMLTYAIYSANSFENFVDGPFLAAFKTILLSTAISGLAGVVAGGITQGAMEYMIPRSAEGSYVPATVGGQLVIVGEGGEGEFIIPESKLVEVVSGGESALNLVTEGLSVANVYSSLYNSTGSDMLTSIIGDNSNSQSVSYMSNSSKSDMYSMNHYSENKTTTNSTMNTKGGDTVINYYINGYTDSELKHIIVDTVNDLVIDSRVKGRDW